MFNVKKLVRNISPRKLVRISSQAHGTQSSARFNSIFTHKAANYRYLEIGTQFGLTLEAVECRSKTGVDPAPKFSTKHLSDEIEIHSEPSDVFFRKLDLNEKWDLIFLDGLHEFHQTLRDFENSLRHLAFSGLIIIDDTVPDDEFSAMPSQVDCNVGRLRLGINRRTWHGDVYKLVLLLAKYPSIFEISTFAYPGNPQTVVRVRDYEQSANFNFSKEDIESISNIKFDAVFADYFSVAKTFNFQFEHILLPNLIDFVSPK